MFPIEHPELSINLLDTVNQFEFNKPGKIEKVLGGWRTGPDAEVYKVMISNEIYYLYLDDFATPDDACRVIADIQGSPKGEFVRVKQEILDKTPLSEGDVKIKEYVAIHPYGFGAAQGLVFFFKPEITHG